jgi:hypothetical protein
LQAPELFDLFYEQSSFPMLLCEYISYYRYFTLYRGDITAFTFYCPIFVFLSSFPVICTSIFYIFSYIVNNNSSLFLVFASLCYASIS